MRYLSTLFIILLFAACGHDSIPTQMQVAEAIMQERPDSALQLLDSIDTATLTTDEQRALYALLLTQARDKNYFLETDDSLISTAVDYYTRQGNKNREQLARYYKGEILLQNGEYGKAVTEALKSLDIAKNEKDWFEIGRCHQIIADAYHSTYNLQQAIVYRDSSYMYFEKAGKNNFAVYALIDLAGEMIGIKDYENGERALIKTSKICPKDDSIALGLIQSLYVNLFRKKGDYQESIKHYHLQHYYFGDNYHEYQNYSHVAEVYLNLNKADSAAYFLEKERNSNPLYKNIYQYYLSNYKLAKQLKNDSLIIASLEELDSINENISGRLIENNVALAEKEFYNRKALEEQYKSFIFKSICIIILILSIAVLIITQVIHRYRLKNQKLENEKKIYQIKLFVDEQQEMMKKLFSERFSEIDTLCAKYFKYIETNKPVSNIVKDVEKQFMAIKDDDSFESLHNYVNCVDNDILTKFKTEIPELKVTDIQFITFKLAGFSPRSICLLLNLSTQNYYTKCTRLRNKVEKTNPIHKNEFLEALKN